MKKREGKGKATEAGGASAPKATIPPVVTQSDEGIDSLLEDLGTERGPSVPLSAWDIDYVRVRFIEPVQMPEGAHAESTTSDHHRIEVDDQGMTATVRSLDTGNPVFVRARLNHVVRGRKRS